ncbi:MAG: tryptophan synthase subunit alpha [Calditrichaceae bacterium]|nr:tryptophan synthase subunit alpha [Calditrichaceae bacterium]RQV96477.1 MAG: tryptophan synthase subunit alpha [Calditrichota bacterium]
MSRRLRELTEQKKSKGDKLLSIYTTAGFPEKDSTVDIVLNLDKAGVDFVELGMPFSDPIADGPVIQMASDRALHNGITTEDLFAIIKQIHLKSGIPIVLMGYFNSLLQYGVEKFIREASQAGADGLILPDWPLEENQRYLKFLKKQDIDLIHLIAPNTKKDRIKMIDTFSSAFVYCVAYTGVTGKDNKPTPETEEFLKYLSKTLKHPWLVGFGIKSHDDYTTYGQYSDGVIIGTAFIKLLDNAPVSERKEAINNFVSDIRGKQS